MAVLASPKQNGAKVLRCPSAPVIHKQTLFSSTTIKIPDAHATAASPHKSLWQKDDVGKQRKSRADESP